MPPFPRRSSQAERIRPSTFEAFGEQLRRCAQDPSFVPLHLGDTFLLPPTAAMGLTLEEPALHRYGPVSGDPALREAGARDLSALGLEVADGDPLDRALQLLARLPPTKATGA